MTHGQLLKTIMLPEYDFLETNPHLGKNIMFLTLGGSHAYGTNVEGSDIDIRGVALNSRSDILGMTSFEQVIDNKTDTTVYAFRKFVGLIMACNPNTIEMLGGRPESYVMLTKAGQLLLDNKKLFLSKRAVNSFGGYANAQLRRLQMGCSKREVGAEQKALYSLESCRHAMRSLEEKHGMPRNFVELSVATDQMECEEPVVLIRPGSGWSEFAKSGAPLNGVRAYLGELASIIKSYDSFGRRNQRAREKSDKQLNKHAMHLVRLYLMAFDILEKGEINTFREKDREFLLEIRNGKYMLEDGTFAPEFFEMVDFFDQRLKRDAAETALPDKPDYKHIEELVMAINEMVVKGDVEL